MNNRLLLKLAMAVVGLCLVALCVLVYLYPPETLSLMPKCILYQATGLHCPGCGVTRAFHHLTHGRVVQALRMNCLAVILLPLLLARLAWQYRVHANRHLPLTLRTPYWVDWGLAALVIGFGLLRNVPIWPFELLAPH